MTRIIDIEDMNFGNKPIIALSNFEDMKRIAETQDEPIYQIEQAV